MGGTGGLQAQMLKLHCTKTHKHAHHTHTHTRTPQTELNHISERDLRFGTKRKHTSTHREAGKHHNSVPPPMGLVHANAAAKNTHTACPLRTKQVGPAQHRLHGASIKVRMAGACLHAGNAR